MTTTLERRVVLTSTKQAVADYPAAIFPEELLKAYPEAVVILTTRSEEAWYNSMMSTLVHYQSTRRPGSSPMLALATKYHTHCWGNDFPFNGRELFNRHNEEVRIAAKGRKFLEYDAQQGWEPLCEFLGVPRQDRPFPRVDDWLEYKKQVEAFKSK